MDNHQFQKCRRQFNSTDHNLLEAEGDNDKFLEDAHKRYAEQKEEVERWAEDWCERGGWRNNRSAHRD